MMKARMIRTLGLMLLSLSLTACSNSFSQRSSKKINEEKCLREENLLPSHNSIQLSGGLTARVIIDPHQMERIILKAEEAKTIAAVKTELKGQQLSVSYRPTGTSPEACIVEIYSKSLSQLELSGAVGCEVCGLWSGEEVELELSGASDLHIAQALQAKRLVVELKGASDLKSSEDIKVGELKLELSGASDAILKGQAAEAEIEVKGSSTLIARGLTVERAKLRVSGASDASLRVTKAADLKASGVSDIKLYGRPAELKKSIQGESSLKHRD